MRSCRHFLKILQAGVSPTSILTALAFLILYGPVVLIVAFSFTSNALMVLPFGKFTLTWYAKLFNNPSVQQSLLNTLVVGFSAVAVSALFGTSGAIAIYIHKYKIEQAITTIVIFPLILPGIIVGLSLLTFFSFLGIRLSLYTVIIAHVTFCTPTVFRTVLARLRQLDTNLIRASTDLYASNGRTLIRVILPSIRTAILSGCLLAFALSFDETLITLLVTGTQNTLPMQIWGMMRRGFTPEVDALASLMFFFAIAVSVAWGLRFRQSEE